MSQNLVLIVDDRPNELKLNSMVMKLCGQEIEAVLGGRKGAEVIQEKIDELKMIILDWMMPDRDAESILTELAPLIKEKNIPVIILSGNALNLSPERKEELAIVDCITKPASKDTFLSVFERFLES